MVEGTFSAYRGLEIGGVKEVRKRHLLVDSNFQLKAGMDLLFVNKQQETGSKIFSCKRLGNTWEVELVQNNLNLTAGMKVYVNANRIEVKEWKEGWQLVSNELL